MSSDGQKKLAEWVRLARSLGWSVRIVRNNHWRFTAPDGRRVFVPGSPGEGRAVANMRADLRRIGLPI